MEPPFTATFEPAAKADSFFATLTLTNEGDAAKWLVLRADLGQRLSAAFSAQLVQRCSFETAPDLRYVQLLGTDTGCIAFWLGPDTSVALDRFSLRAHGKPACEVWEVSAITVGDRALEDCFDGLQVAKLTTVPEAFRRSTDATLEGAPHEVTLDVIKPWAISV